MNNQTSWSEQLQRIGMSEFSSAHQDILMQLRESRIPIGSASLSQASAEALIRAVSVMIEENNKAVLTELEQSLFILHYFF